jgi:hypothetical protein
LAVTITPLGRAPLERPCRGLIENAVIHQKCKGRLAIARCLREGVIGFRISDESTSRARKRVFRNEGYSDDRSMEIPTRTGAEGERRQ